MHQIAIENTVKPEEIAREGSLGGAMELCAKAAGCTLEKQITATASLDKAQWSRIKSGIEGIKWDKLEAFMDAFGNDAPLFWMLHRRGYDLHSLRKLESETEKALRIAKEEIERLRNDKRVLADAIRGVTV